VGWEHLSKYVGTGYGEDRAGCDAAGDYTERVGSREQDVWDHGQRFSNRFIDVERDVGSVFDAAGLLGDFGLLYGPIGVFNDRARRGGEDSDGTSDGYGYISMYANSTLTAVGTAAKPIVFTSMRDDSVMNDAQPGDTAAPAPGDWRAIWVIGPAANRLDHVVLTYGGKTNWDPQPN